MKRFVPALFQKFQRIQNNSSCLLRRDLISKTATRISKGHLEARQHTIAQVLGKINALWKTGFFYANDSIKKGGFGFEIRLCIKWNFLFQSKPLGRGVWTNVIFWLYRKSFLLIKCLRLLCLQLNDVRYFEGPFRSAPAYYCCTWKN